MSNAVSMHIIYKKSKPLYIHKYGTIDSGTHEVKNKLSLTNKTTKKGNVLQNALLTQVLTTGFSM